MKLSEQEMKEYDRYVEDVRYRNSMVSSNFNMGKIEGEKIGIQKGIQEGREKGIQEGQAKLIKNLLASGMSVEQVAMATKMIPSEVEKLTQIYRDY